MTEPLLIRYKEAEEPAGVMRARRCRNAWCRRFIALESVALARPIETAAEVMGTDELNCDVWTCGACGTPNYFPVLSEAKNA